MSDQPSDRIELGSTELPEVLRTLSGVLPQFAGDDLESQLQTYDIFLGTLAPSVRPQIANLLKEAASRAPTTDVRARIEGAAESVAQGGRAAEPYDHAKAMQAYRESFRKSFPNAPEPAPAPDPRGENDLASGEKRNHPEILAQLDLIETEMKRIGFWSDHPPDLQAALDRGEIKSFLDAPSFELWLQGIFLPHARQWTLEDELPATSQVGELARRQYDYMSVDPNAEELMHLLRRFDELIEQAAQGRA